MDKLSNLLSSMNILNEADDLFDIEKYNQGDEFEMTEDGSLEVSSFNSKDYI